MTDQVNTEDYLWIIVDKPQEATEEETFLGLADDQGVQFIPATREKADGEILMRMLPSQENTERSVEAIHRDQLLAQAKDQGFNVFVVDSQGKVLQRLT